MTVLLRATLAVSLAAMLVFLAPGMVRAVEAQPASDSPDCEQQTVLPDGEELSQQQLLEAEGEFFWVVVELGRRVAVGIITGASAYFFTDADALQAAQLGLVAMIVSCI